MPMTPKQWTLIALVVAVAAASIWLWLIPPPAEDVEFITDQWEQSSHSAAESESFTHWDEDDPPIIPVECAKCHSLWGFRDFLGLDGSEFGVVDQEADPGTTIHCIACHNSRVQSMTSVVFPSGDSISQLGPEAVCMQCKQGTRSRSDVEEEIGDLPLDTVSSDLPFINVHYYIAAATWLGGEVGAGYEYPDHTYVRRYEHVPDLQTCVDCHDPHNQLVDHELCSPCHVAVTDAADLPAIRTSDTDYDGDGDANEGLAAEIETLQEKLYVALQAYASQVAGTPIVYADQFPYYVVDTNGNEEADESELTPANRYSSWTPRLLRAGYNYHFSFQDEGNYVHNGRYVLQLLEDSLMDLGERVAIDRGGIIRPVSGE